MNVLITNNTLSGVSSPFDVEGQLTVFAFGLSDEQRVSFWIVQLSDPLRDQCGCPPYSPTMPSIVDEVPYECCNTQVILTADRPWVIIDSPQGAKIIAKLEQLVDDVWEPVAPPDGQKVYWVPTSTPNVTDCMRGCRCEDDVWTTTGFTICDVDNNAVRVEEVSNCGTKRWVDCGSIVWTPTGQTFCVPETAAGEDGDCNLNDFGFTQAGYYIEVRNVCGQTRWDYACGLTWQETGNIRCEDGFILVEERSTVCGFTRWTETGESVTWVATGNYRCTSTNYEREERDNCGNPRWVSNGPLNWQPTGNYDCRNNINWREERNQCNAPRWINTGESCGTSTHTMSSLTPQSASVIEGQTACWDFVLDSPVIGTPLTIEFNLSGADQVRNAYSTPRSVTVAVGASSGQLCIVTTDDATIDGTEQLCVTPVLSARLTNAPAASCINVLDNDETGSSHTVTWGEAPATATEGEEVCWDIVLDGPVSGSNLNLVFDWTGTDAARNGYPNSTVTIAVGDSAGTLCLTTTDDTDIDGTETLCPVLLANPRVTVGPGAQCVDVLDNDTGSSVHTITCVTPPVEATEGALVCWTFQLDAPVSGTPLTVTGVLSGSEQTARGYPNPSVVIGIGQSSGTLCVQTLDDTDVEATLQLCLTISTSSRVTSVNDAPCP